MKAKIYVTLKSGIVDPQGRAIEQSLATLGFPTVKTVRVGKCLDIDFDATSQSQAESQLKAMCEKLLANTVIEDYWYEVETINPLTTP